MLVIEATESTSKLVGVPCRTHGSLLCSLASTPLGLG